MFRWSYSNLISGWSTSWMKKLKRKFPLGDWTKLKVARQSCRSRSSRTTCSPNLPVVKLYCVCHDSDQWRVGEKEMLPFSVWFGGDVGIGTPRESKRGRCFCTSYEREAL